MHNKENNKQRRLRDKERQVETLDDIPCGTSFQTCKFIKDAYAAKAQIPSDKEEIEVLLKEITELLESDPSLGEQITVFENEETHDDLKRVSPKSST